MHASRPKGAPVVQLSPDTIAAVPQAERLQLMLQVKAGTLTLRQASIYVLVMQAVLTLLMQMHCLLLTKAQAQTGPSLPDRPANMSVRRAPLATPATAPAGEAVQAPTTAGMTEPELVYDDGAS